MPWGFEAEVPRPFRFVSTPPHLDLVLPAAMMPWGFEAEVPRPFRFVSTAPHLDLVLPAAMMPWGFEAEVPRPFRFVSTPPHLDLVLPAAMMLWGFEAEVPRPFRFVSTPPHLDLILPAFATAWGFEPEIPRPFKFIQTPPQLDQVTFPLIKPIAGFEPEVPTNPYKFIQTFPFIDLVLPKIAKPIYWGIEPEIPRPARFSPIPPHLEQILPAIAVPPPIGPWDFEATPPRLTKLPPLLPANFESIPPVLTPWGWDSELPRLLALHHTAPVSEVILLFPVTPPKPPLVVNMMAGGRSIDIELIDDFSERYINDYIRQLGDFDEDDEDDYEDDVEEKPSIIPDAVLGREEYKREKIVQQKQRRIEEESAKTAYRFESSMDPISCHRVMLFVKDANNKGMTIRSADAFSLKYRLGIFKDDYEKMMLDGSMVKIVPNRAVHRMTLADLAKHHKYKVVAWSNNGLFLFDETTLRAKTPGWFWLALGASGGFLVSYDLWKQHKLLKYQDMQELNKQLTGIEQRLAKLEKKKKK